MNIVNLKIKDLKPYEKNAKKHDDAQIGNVAESIKQFGMVQPIVVDKDNVVIIGHCRLEACKKLKYKEVPCVKADELSEEQVAKLRLLDNKLNESEWDFDLLGEELIDLDMSDFELDWGLDFEEPQLETEKENPYTTKITTPVYEAKGKCPKITELVDTDKTKSLIEKIEKASITEEQKQFLKNASQRHLCFNYEKIAEYYCHQNKEMQELMEQSALVIIDFNQAIENGYVELRKEIETLTEVGESE